MQAGSDSISMFEINPIDPTQIFQVGAPVNSGGNFPVSVDVSSKTGNGELELYDRLKIKEIHDAYSLRSQRWS
jgi:hypothetical protein